MYSAISSRWSSDTAKLAGLHIDAHGVAQRYTRADFLCILEGNLSQRILRLIDYLFGHIHMNGFFVHIRLDIDIIALQTVVVLFIRGQQGLTYAIQHVIYRNPLFLFQLLQSCKKFCVHVFGIHSLLCAAWRGAIPD